MSLFALVSNDVVLAVGPYAQVHPLASEQARQGNQVTLHRVSPNETGTGCCSWVVQIRAAGITDVLHCLDEDDAQETLRQVRELGLHAEVQCITRLNSI